MKESWRYHGRTLGRSKDSCYKPLKLMLKIVFTFEVKVNYLIIWPNTNMQVALGSLGAFVFIVHFIPGMQGFTCVFQKEYMQQLQALCCYSKIAFKVILYTPTVYCLYYIPFAILICSYILRLLGMAILKASVYGYINLYINKKHILPFHLFISGTHKPLYTREITITI